MVPEGWKRKALADIAAVERGKFSARPRNDPQYYGGTIPFIQTGDVATSSGRIISHSQTLNERGLAVSRLFPKGTIFITIAANIGNVAIADFDTACPDSVVAVQPRDGASVKRPPGINYKFTDSPVPAIRHMGSPDESYRYF